MRWRFLKAENLQRTGAFKVRGALAALTASAHKDPRPVVTASAGNFGQGVALAAAHVGRRAWVLVPETTPQSKVHRIRRLGAEVRVAGRSFDETDALAVNWRSRKVVSSDPPLSKTVAGSVCC